MTWQVGDRVTLMTSGIPMTVEKVNGDQTTCVWIHVRGRSERDTFAAGALKKYEGRKPIHFVF